MSGEGGGEGGVVGEEEEGYECEECGVRVQAEVYWGIDYGVLSMSFCEQCYQDTKDAIDGDSEDEEDSV